MGNSSFKRQNLEDESVDFEKYVESFKMESVDSYKVKIKAYIKAVHNWDESIEKYKKINSEKTNSEIDKSIDQIDQELLQNIKLTEQALLALKPSPQGNYSLPKNEIKEIYDKAELWYKKKNDEFNQIYSPRSKNLDENKK